MSCVINWKSGCASRTRLVSKPLHFGVDRRPCCRFTKNADVKANEGSTYDEKPQTIHWWLSSEERQLGKCRHLRIKVLNLHTDGKPIKQLYLTMRGGNRIIVSSGAIALYILLLNYFIRWHVVARLIRRRRRRESWWRVGWRSKRIPLPTRTTRIFNSFVWRWDWRIESQSI